MKKIKVGLAGLGFMGTTHLGIYRGLKDVEVVAIADLDPAKLKGDISKVVGNIGGGDNSKLLEMKGIKTYSSAFDLLSNSEIDIMDICVPTPDHQKIAVAALQGGRHVICEKPVCRTVAELEELAEVARESEKFFNAGMCVRAWPEYYHAQSMFKAGKFGKIITAGFRRLSPNISGNSWDNWFMDAKKSGGALLDLHLHDTDFIRFMFGRPEAVTSFGINSVRSDGGVDYVMTNYSFPGSLITAEGGWCASRKVPFEMSFQMIFEKATVRLAGEGYKIYWENGDVESPQVADAALPTGWHQELAYFVNCVRDNVKPDKYQDMADIVDSFKIVAAEQKSVDTGKTVKIKY